MRQFVFQVSRSRESVCGCVRLWMGMCLCVNQSLIISTRMQTKVIAPDCAPPPQV